MFRMMVKIQDDRQNDHQHGEQKQHNMSSGQRLRPSRAVDAPICNLTTACVVFVHHVGGHFGDNFDNCSKHLHSVHESSHINSPN